MEEGSNVFTVYRCSHCLANFSLEKLCYEHLLSHSSKDHSIIKTKVDTLLENRTLSENTEVSEVSENTKVSENTGRSEKIEVLEYTGVSENTDVSKNIEVSKNTKVSANTKVSENTGVSENAEVLEYTGVSENTEVSENIKVLKKTKVSANTKVKKSRNRSKIMVPGSDTRKEFNRRTSETKKKKRHYHKKGEFECKICGKIWKLHCDLMSHHIKHSEYRPFKCNVCKKMFKRMSHLNRHKMSHDPRTLERVKCPRCHVLYTEKDLLIKHYQDHHLADDDNTRVFDRIVNPSGSESSTSDEPSKASGRGDDASGICIDLLSKYTSEGKAFRKYYMKVDNACYIVNIPETSDEHSQNVTLDVDGRLFTIIIKGSESDVLVVRKSEDDQCHVQAKQKKRSKGSLVPSAKTPKKVWRCDLHEESFNDSNALRKHVKSHKVPESMKAQKKYSCGLCEAKFRVVASLKTHMKMHSLTNVFHCKVCGRVFTRPSLLELHERIHTGHKPFLCEICPKTFRTKSLLNRHTLGHSGEKPHPCPTCDKRFPDISCRNAHMRKHHPLVEIPMTRGSSKLTVGHSP